MTIKIFDKIKKIIDEICLYVDEINEDEKEYIYYNCYLVVYQIRNGFYPEIFNKIDEKILKKIKTIPNLDFIKCSCYDASRFPDTIYIFNKNKYNSIKKSIEFLNKTKRDNSGINSKKGLKIHSNIANLLSYDKIKRSYNEAYDHKKTLLISFIIYDYTDINNIKQIEIMSYQSYKSKLVKNYEKLQQINNLPIFDRYKRFRCFLKIDDIGL